MDDLSLISIIIPTRNSEATIENCIKYIKNQTYPQIELIIVDNYSTDKTIKIANNYHAKIVLQGGGMSVQVNRGIKEANGIYACYIDADMYLSKKVIEKCHNKLLENYDAIIIPEICCENSFWAKCRNIEKQLYLNKSNIEGIRFFKKDIFNKVGGMDEGLLGFRDYDLHQKILKKGYRIGRLSEEKIYHDINPNLKDILVKRFLRSGTFYDYYKIHPKHSKTIVFRSILITSFPEIISQYHIHGVGFYILKILEYYVSFVGLITYFFLRPLYSHQNSNLNIEDVNTQQSNSYNYSAREAEERKIWLINKFITKNSFVLDLGCGNGCYIPFLLSRTENVVGIDIDITLCSHSRDTDKRSNIICANAIHLPFRNKIFDIIWASEILEHLPSWNVLSVLENLSKKIVATIPNPYFPSYSKDPTHILKYNWEAIRHNLKSRRKTGWKYIIRGIGYYGIPVSKYIKLITTILTYYIPILSPSIAIIGNIEKNE